MKNADRIDDTEEDDGVDDDNDDDYDNDDEGDDMCSTYLLRNDHVNNQL